VLVRATPSTGGRTPGRHIDDDLKHRVAASIITAYRSPSRSPGDLRIGQDLGTPAAED
jgi:hypothetical protein